MQFAARRTAARREFLCLGALVMALHPVVGYGQRVSFGLVGGTNLTRDFPLFRSTYFDQENLGGLATVDLLSGDRGFLAGVSVEVRFGKGVSLEGNALHRTLRLQSRVTLPHQTALSNGSTSISTWQWPVLLKYQLPPAGPMRFFVEGGPSFRTRDNPAPTEPSQAGGTMGAGTEFRFGRLRVSPAIRYTRWQSDGGRTPVVSKRDQLELVTGISYATSIPAWRVAGRKLRFGLMAGTPFTSGFTQQPLFGKIEEAQGYIGGLALEVELNERWAVEVNGLYRPFRADLIQTSPPPVGTFRSDFTVLTWQIPVLAKFRASSLSRIVPVGEAGPSFRLSGNLNAYRPSAYGFTAGGGVEARYQALKVSPVVRYTRWAADPVRQGGRTVQNQVELLVGFTF